MGFYVSLSWLLIAGDTTCIQNIGKLTHPITAGTFGTANSFEQTRVRRTSPVSGVSIHHLSSEALQFFCRCYI